MRKGKNITYFGELNLGNKPNGRGIEIEYDGRGGGGVHFGNYENGKVTTGPYLYCWDGDYDFETGEKKMVDGTL